MESVALESDFSKMLSYKNQIRIFLELNSKLEIIIPSQKDQQIFHNSEGYLRQLEIKKKLLPKLFIDFRKKNKP